MDSFKRQSDGALINNDDTQYQMILSERENRKEKQQMQEELQLLRKEVDQIKVLLIQHLEASK